MKPSGSGILDNARRIFHEVYEQHTKDIFAPDEMKKAFATAGEVAFLRALMAYTEQYGNEMKTLMIKGVHETIGASVRKRLSPTGRVAIDETCETCRTYRGQMAPPHQASKNCESGGHDHCTCDVCF